MLSMCYVFYETIVYEFLLYINIFNFYHLLKQS